MGMMGNKEQNFLETRVQVQNFKTTLICGSESNSVVFPCGVRSITEAKPSVTESSLVPRLVDIWLVFSL